ncbi:g5967 [Coccomyxa viridis]|uniref:G5967 protein n=1 Tax=Coccomyxa viridis TaxID=1274662 RepID=A0ABP1FU80_9CHLO
MALMCMARAPGKAWSAPGFNEAWGPKGSLLGSGECQGQACLSRPADPVVASAQPQCPSHAVVALYKQFMAPDTEEARMRGWRAAGVDHPTCTKSEGEEHFPLDLLHIARVKQSLSSQRL